MRSAGRGLLAVMLVFGGYATMSGAASAPSKTENRVMWMTVGEHRFAITLADNAATRAFVTLLPLTVAMSDLNRNEKYATLPQVLPAEASKPGTIRNGNLMLYGTDTLVVFYTNFNSTYAYTRLGQVDDTEKLAQALGRRDVQVSFSQH
ncbi:cyclophilin-like fold protein [Pseudomonas sp. Z3-6]|uniref:cyclophilin-like fold protein n=1 Tax=Pseudomonas sp. Z3-6 TaxID=2817411 RepID=UPI003DAA3AC8